MKFRCFQCFGVRTFAKFRYQFFQISRNSAKFRKISQNFAKSDIQTKFRKISLIICREIYILELFWRFLVEFLLIFAKMLVDTWQIRNLFWKISRNSENLIEISRNFAKFTNSFLNLWKFLLKKYWFLRIFRSNKHWLSSDCLWRQKIFWRQMMWWNISYDATNTVYTICGRFTCVIRHLNNIQKFRIFHPFRENCSEKSSSFRENLDNKL